MASEWIQTTSRYADIPGVDPYIDLALGMPEGGFYARERQQPWTSVLLRLNDISASEFADGEFYHDPEWRAWWRKLVHVPALYRRPVAGLAAQRSCTAYVPRREFFDDLLAGFRPLQEAVAQITFGKFSDGDHSPPEAPVAGPDAEQAEPSGNPEPTVVIGVIDDGLAFAHERFRSSPYETRVEYLWLQDGRDDPKGSPVPYGRELRKRDIDSLLKDYQSAGFVDEDDLYRRAGVIDFGSDGRKPLARRLAHGTHVMDLACGYDFRPGPRRDRPIVCVQLPVAASEDTSGATLDDYGLDAVRYILDRADEIARARKCGRLPVVINFSYGIVAGPHDGTSDLEVAIDDLIAARPKTYVVLPAGNSELERLHARVPLQAPGRDRSIALARVAGRRDPDLHGDLAAAGTAGAGREPDQAPSGAARTSPEPGTRGRVGFGTAVAAGWRGLLRGALPPHARPRGRSGARHVPRGAATERPARTLCGRRSRLRVCGRSSSRTCRSPPGIRSKPGSSGMTRPTAFDAAGGSRYFDERCLTSGSTLKGGMVEEDTNPEQASHRPDVKRAGSINAIATGRRTVVVGGFLGKENRRAPYSAEPAPGSPLEDHVRYEVSDDSFVHDGRLAAGTRSGSKTIMGGTSVAAPERARRIADELAGTSRYSNPWEPKRP